MFIIRKCKEHFSQPATTYSKLTETKCEICSNLIIKTPEHSSGVFTVNYEHTSHLVLVFLLLTLST